MSPKQPLSAPLGLRASCSEHGSSELASDSHTADFRKSTSPKHPSDDTERGPPPPPSLPGGQGQACMLGGVRENRSRKAAPLRVPRVFSAAPVRELHLAPVCPRSFQILKDANNKELNFSFSVLPLCGIPNNGKSEPKQVTRKRTQHPTGCRADPKPLVRPSSGKWRLTCQIDNVTFLPEPAPCRLLCYQVTSPAQQTFSQELEKTAVYERL